MTADVTFSGAFQQGVSEEMTRDESIFVLGTDLYDRGGHFAQVKGLGPEFGHERVRDAPISEAAMVAAGVGAALNGLRPLIDLNFIDFSFGAMDEIVNQAAKIRYMWGTPVPLVIRATSGVAQGGPQHNNSLEAWFSHMPGLAVVVPFRPYDVKGLIKTALRGSDPVIFMMHKRLSGVRGEVAGPDGLVPIGSARLARAHDDARLTIVSYGYGVQLSLQASEVLAEDGVEVEVVDLRTLSPLDMETIYDSVRRTGRVAVVDEAPPHAGIAAEISAAISEGVFFYLDRAVARVTAKDAPIPHSPALVSAILPQVAEVATTLRGLLVDD